MSVEETFVVPDAHGNANLVRGLLEQEGIIKQDWSDEAESPYATRLRPSSEVEVVQIGDLGNCVLASSNHDYEAFDLVRKGIIDIWLIGNHEHPYFGGPKFNGFSPDPVVQMAINSIERSSSMKAAHAVADILITHAGLPIWAHRRLGTDLTTAGLARAINKAWEKDPNDPIFSAIGASRGGSSPVGGGILWSDWREKKPRGLKQIFGHTVGDKVRMEGTVICLDLGAGKNSSRIAGAWVRGGDVEVVIYEDKETRWAA